MLAVITDDFTGASEIGGVALEQGYRTIIETRNVSRGDAEVLVVATNMRSLDPESAREKSRLLTGQLLSLEPDLIFKKVDSVLRGNIGPELAAQMRVEGKPRALLVPANPSRRRIIVNGIYYVDDVPIAESGFAGNYDFGSSTSRVVDILKDRGADEAFSLSQGEPFGGDGVYIGNARGSSDLRAWAGRISDDAVPAGAADFFSAVLESRSGANSYTNAAYTHNGEGRRLFICGSNFPSSRGAVSDARENGFLVVGMPDEIYFNREIAPEMLDRWAEGVFSALNDHHDVIITASQTPNERSLAGRKISAAMAGVARRVISGVKIDDLMIEGGATAQAVLSELDIGSLFPVQSLAPGVTRMQANGYPDLHVTMKPGSYGWPDVLWHSASRARRGEHE